MRTLFYKPVFTQSDVHNNLYADHSPEVWVLEVEGVGGHGGGALNLALDGEVVALLGIRHH